MDSFESEWEGEVGAALFAAQTIVYLPRDIALYFLALVGARVALAGDRDLATDHEIFTDVVFHDVRTTRGSVAMATMAAYLPEGFERLSPSRLADLRADLASSRLRYQAVVQQLVQEFSVISSEGELKRSERGIIEVAHERVQETQRAYRRASLQMVTDTFGITLTPPAVITSVASALGMGIFAPAGIAAAVSLFGARTLLKRSDARAEREKSPWSYVLEVSRAK